MHRRRNVPFDKVRFITIAGEQLRQLIVADPCKYRRVGDLVSVQMQNRKNHSVASWVEKLVGMPACRERAGFCLAVADYAGRDQIRIVEDRSVSVSERVAELAAFVDRPWSFSCDVTRNPSGK